MSGRKNTTTTIGVDELRRLRTEASRASSLAASNTALTRLSRANDTFLNQQQLRINQINQTLSSISDTIRSQSNVISEERRQLRAQLDNVVADSTRRMEQLAADNQSQIAELNSQFISRLREERTNTAAMLDSYSQANAHALESVIQSFNTSLGAVSDRIIHVEDQAAETARRVGVLFDSDHSLLEMAREYADTTRLVLENISASFRTEILAPGRLQLAQNQLAQANQDIIDCADHPTNASAARMSGRRAFQTAMELREELAAAEQCWQNRYREASQALNTASEQCELCHTLKVPDCAESIDVDHWSNGDITAIAQRIEGLQSALDNASGLDIDALDGIRLASVQAARDVLETAEFAFVAANSSQDRADIAQSVADHLLETLGLVVQLQGYSGNDQRGAHRVHLKNPMTGFEMVVTQHPVVEDGRVCGNRLESDILNYGTCNAADGDGIVAQALAGLSDLGLSMGSVETVAGYENVCSERQELRDMVQWGQQAADIPSPAHKPAQSGRAAQGNS